jgi:hypothetical protein
MVCSNRCLDKIDRRATGAKRRQCMVHEMVADMMEHILTAPG